MHSPNKLLRFANMFYSMAAGEELPANSDNLKTILSNLENLETYTARKKYAEQNLTRLSSGSSRLTYLTPSKTVVKLVKNKKGEAQNAAEVEASNKINSKYLNKVLEHAKNYSWIEVPFLDKLTEKEFKKLTDIDFDDFGNALRYSLKSVSGNSDKEKPENYDDISKNEMFKEITKAGKELDLLPGDLAKISSYGRKDNYPVLLDLGLNRTIYNEHYEDNSSS